MTSQSRKFIELSDILALNFTCKHCKSAISVLLGEYQKKKREGVIGHCPVCSNPWARISGATCELNVERFVEGIIDMERTLGAQPGAFPAGFSLTIEIKDDKPLPPQAK